MSQFKTRHVCPVPMCGWFADTDFFSKKPNDLAQKMGVHLATKHPIYRRWVTFLLRRNLKKKAGRK